MIIREQRKYIYVSMLKIYDTPPFWEFKGGKKKYVLWNQRSEIEFG